MDDLTIAELLERLKTTEDAEERTTLANRYPLLITEKPKMLAELAFLLLRADDMEQLLKQKLTQKKQSEVVVPVPVLGKNFFEQFQHLGQKIQAEGGNGKKRKLLTQPTIIKDPEGNILEIRKPQGRPPKDVQPIEIVVSEPKTKKVTTTALQRKVEELQYVPLAHEEQPENWSAIFND